MRFLQIVMSSMPSSTPTPRTPEHVARMRKEIQERITAGSLLATGGLGKRATSAARVTRRGGEVSIEDPPRGDGWMAGGGYSLGEYGSKEEAIANAKTTLEMMGDGVVELIQVSELHPPPGHVAAHPRRSSQRRIGGLSTKPLNARPICIDDLPRSAGNGCLHSRRASRSLWCLRRP